MGSEQSSAAPRAAGRAPVRRGHTIAAPSTAPEVRREPPASGNNSPGASVCSDSELPYISYTVGRPIGDSPKSSTKNQRQESKKSLLQRRQMSLRARTSKRARDIVVVTGQTTAALDEDIRRLQETPTFLPIMRGALGLPGARDPEVLEGLDARPWVRLCARLQAHLAACATPLAQEQVQLATKLKEADAEVSRLYSLMVDKQRANARHAERLARVHEAAHQLSRSHSLLQQTLSDVEELNALLPPDRRLEPFVWGPPGPGPAAAPVWGPPGPGPAAAPVWGPPGPGPAAAPVWGPPGPGPAAAPVWGPPGPGPAAAPVWGPPGPGPAPAS